VPLWTGALLVGVFALGRVGTCFADFPWPVGCFLAKAGEFGRLDDGLEELEPFSFRTATGSLDDVPDGGWGVFERLVMGLLVATSLCARLRLLDIFAFLLGMVDSGTSGDWSFSRYQSLGDGGSASAREKLRRWRLVGLLRFDSDVRLCLVLSMP
jgi:hypothetical protein